MYFPRWDGVEVSSAHCVEDGFEVLRTIGAKSAHILRSESVTVRERQTEQ
jgi:hypothetical protein